MSTWEDPKVIVAGIAATIALFAMGVSAYCATRAFLGTATHANFTHTAKAIEMIKGPNGLQLLRFLGLSPADLSAKGLSADDFVFVTLLLLGRAAYYELSSQHEPMEYVFKIDTFSRFLCKQKPIRDVWALLEPIWGKDEAFCQIMNRTIAELKVRGEIP